MSYRDLSRLPDYTTTPEGAEALIERIKKVWEAKGFKAPELKALHPPYGETRGRPRVDVRSDMVNGLPRHKAEGSRA